MLNEEILKKVKLLEISTRKLVNNLFAGEYHTVFKGQGLTFADFREYIPGDDIRAISWNLTAKAGRPFIKRFDEERELTLVLAVDVSGSGDFGSKDFLKGEVLVQLAAMLAFAATRNNDKVGLLLFSDQAEHWVEPRKGRGHVHRILRDMLYFKPKSRGTEIKTALEYLSGVLHKRATVFILSDFLDQGYDRALAILGKRHDVVAVVCEDEAELKLPPVGLVDIQDAETGEIVTVDTSSKKFQQIYQVQQKKIKAQRDQLLNRTQVDQIRVDTTHSFVDPLVAFFSSRHKR
jgi:uncharacterized protein (DUF58 family)